MDQPAFANPPDTSRDGFLDLIDRILAWLPDDPIRLCGSIPCDVYPGEPPEYVYSPPRLLVVLEGRDTYATSVAGSRVDIELLPGQSVFWGANSWSIPFFSTLNKAFGVVFKPQHVRLIQIIMDGTRQVARSPWSYHTSGPLAGPGSHLVRAMSGMAELGRSTSATRATFVALLEVVRQHLAEDVAEVQSHQRAIATWESVRARLEEHFDRNVSRESVARELGLHPNYLSALARRSSGQSFHDVLQSIRMQHARRLLRETDLKLARIAPLCGYRDATRFVAVFRRTAGMTPGQFRRMASNA